MILLWLIVGCVLVSVAFFLPGHSPDLWPNLNAAGIATIVYLAAILVMFVRRKDLTVRRRAIASIIAVVGIAGGVFAWTHMNYQTEWQRQQLGKIGTVIGRGIYTAYVTDSLLVVLEDYHHQKGKARMTLAQIYRKRYPPGKPGDTWSSMAPTGMANPPNDVFLAAISDTQIVVVARHPWFRGKDASFATYNGPKGTIQIRATLTEKGLQYDTEN
ncbi:MAG: NADH-quinone oxidoreductase subunit J [Bacteroidota bacterium]